LEYQAGVVNFLHKKNPLARICNTEGTGLFLETGSLAKRKKQKDGITFETDIPEKTCASCRSYCAATQQSKLQYSLYIHFFLTSYY